VETSITLHRFKGEEMRMGEMRRRFTKEYKVEAVCLATVGDKSLAQVARELGCGLMCYGSGSGSSRRWARQRRFRTTVARQEQRRSCSDCGARWSS
jgi:transposase-like protein